LENADSEQEVRRPRARRPPARLIFYKTGGDPYEVHQSFSETMEEMLTTQPRSEQASWISEREEKPATTHDEASAQAEVASDPGEGPAEAVAGTREDEERPTGGLRWSDRRSHPPTRFSYKELGEPTNVESVPEEGLRLGAQVNASTVHSWWNWLY
jgi:hypothetical protein